MKQIKKQVLFVLCMVACLFALTACGKASDTGSGIDPMVQESLKQQTVTLLEQVTAVPADQMTMIIEQNRKTGSEALAAGLESYVGLEKDLGAYISSGETSVKEIDNGYEVTVDAVFEKRACVFSIDLDEEMTTITGMSFAPVYTLGENMEKAGLNTLMGMGTVFCVLIFISLLISCFKYISVWENKKKETAPAAPAPAPAAAAPAPVALTAAAPAGTDDAEMERLAIMTAIIEHRRRTASTDSLVVRPIKRSAGNRWKKS